MSDATADETMTSAHSGNGAPAKGETLLTVNGLTKYFPVMRGFIVRRQSGLVRAVDGVSFEINAGETLGLVGESGCGKTTTGNTIMQLEPPTAGEVVFEGNDLVQLSRDDQRRARRKMQMIFQDPYGSLNPRMSVGRIIEEPLQVHDLHGKRDERRERVRELLRLVGSTRASPAVTRTNFPAVSGSALRSPARWPCSRHSSSATSRYRRWTCRSRRRS